MPASDDGHRTRPARRDEDFAVFQPDEQAKISNETLGETKADIALYLASKAGCVLVDPVCAVPGLVDNDILPRDTALLIGIDASGWGTSPEGYRISKLVEGVDARRVRGLWGDRWQDHGLPAHGYARGERPES